MILKNKIKKYQNCKVNKIKYDELNFLIFVFIIIF